MEICPKNVDGFAGELVEEVHLPSQVWEIGRYALTALPVETSVFLQTEPPKHRGRSVYRMPACQIGYSMQTDKAGLVSDSFWRNSSFELEVRDFLRRRGEQRGSGTAHFPGTTMGRRRWRILRHGSWRNPLPWGGWGLSAVRSITREIDYEEYDSPVCQGIGVGERADID
ncbi:MAG: hypothetical protein ACLUUO_03410 [Sellimonas intestinalis]